MLALLLFYGSNSFSSLPDESSTIKLFAVSFAIYSSSARYYAACMGAIAFGVSLKRKHQCGKHEGKMDRQKPAATSHACLCAKAPCRGTQGPPGKIRRKKRKSISSPALSRRINRSAWPGGAPAEQPPPPKCLKRQARLPHRPPATPQSRPPPGPWAWGQV